MPHRLFAKNKGGHRVLGKGQDSKGRQLKKQVLDKVTRAETKQIIAEAFSMDEDDDLPAVGMEDGEE